MANSVPPVNGIMVITHVYPEQGAQSVTSHQNRAVLPVTCQLGKFLKGEPEALGTVEIMIGIIVLLFGVVTAFNAIAISIYSGIMFWGAIIYITAGSLTVKANKKLNQCLVKASLGMNILSTVTAGIAIIMHSLDFILASYVSCVFMICEIFLSRSWGIAGVMLVLSVLEFIISICVSAFACKATCRSDTEMQLTPPTVFPPAQNSNAEGLGSGKPEDMPPGYTEVQK